MGRIGRPSVADYPPGAVLPRRTLDDCEVVWMLRGDARLVGPEGESALAPGQVLLIPPGFPHGFAWDRSRPSRHGYVHFDPEGVAADPPAEPLVRPMTRQDPLGGLCAYLLWLGQLGGEAWRRHGPETLGFLLSLLESRPLPGTESSPRPGPPLDAAIEHLRREWSRMPLRRVGVTELAAAAMVSRGYLGRLFREWFGVSPARAVEGVRLARVETLLTRTDLPVETIARECGFADPSHLAHRFGATHGTSPSAYRAQATPEASVLDHPGVRRLAHLLWW